MSTHGTTKRGRYQAHKDDCDEFGHAAAARKCPKILNDWTMAQPHVDKSNRWRQRILAVEERFPTNSFPFRATTTVMLGMSIASAFTLYQYHVNADMHAAFRDFVEEVAYDGMLNTWDAQHAPIPVGGRAEIPTPRHPHVEPVGPSDEPAHRHIPIPISAVEGFKGSHQQRCAHCKDRTSYCCAACSSALGVVPIHKAETKYRGMATATQCLAVHRRAPELHPLTTASSSRQRGANSRRQQRPSPTTEL